MKNQKLGAHFFDADASADDGPEEGAPAAPPNAGPDWVTCYPRTTNVLPAILSAAFAQLFSPRNEAGRAMCVPHMIVHKFVDAKEPLTLLYSFAEEDGTPSEMHEGLIRKFLTNLASLRVDGVMVALNETHGAISFDSPEIVRQFLHEMCNRGPLVFDESSSFRMRPFGAAPCEFDETPAQNQLQHNAELSAEYGERGEQIMQKGQLEILTSLMPSRPYISLREALAAAAYVGKRQTMGHFKFSLDGIDSMVAADYGQPLPQSYSLFH